MYPSHHHKHSSSRYRPYKIIYPILTNKQSKYIVDRFDFDYQRQIEAIINNGQNQQQQQQRDYNNISNYERNVSRTINVG